MCIDGGGPPPIGVVGEAAHGVVKASKGDEKRGMLPLDTIIKYQQAKSTFLGRYFSNHQNGSQDLVTVNTPSIPCSNSSKNAQTPFREPRPPTVA